jgi:glycosyltransferase involved in cell wall biosynthesis
MSGGLKVLHIISNLMSGGAEAMLSKVVRATAKGGVEHVVVTMLAGGAVADELAEGGIRVLALGTHRSASALAALTCVRPLLRSERPDVVQGWMYHGNVAALAATAWFRPPIPVVWNIRQSLPTLENEALATKALILAGIPMSRRADTSVYNSVRAAEDHERRGYSPRRRVIIANGFDTQLFAPEPAARAALLRELAAPHDAVLVGRVGNYMVLKDYPMLLKAFARIGKANPTAYLVLIGRDVSEANAAFAALLEGFPYRDRIRALGERRDVAKLIPGLDIMLSSSLSEAFPNIIGEAMACGVPTIATDAGDCRKILGDANRIVTVGDAEALAQKTLAILALPAAERAAIGARDRARVVADYSIETIAAEYAALWRRLAA